MVKDGKLDKHGKPNASTPKDYLKEMGMDSNGGVTPTANGATSAEPENGSDEMSESPKEKKKDKKKKEKKEKKSKKEKD